MLLKLVWDESAYRLEYHLLWEYDSGKPPTSYVNNPIVVFLQDTIGVLQEKLIKKHVNISKCNSAFLTTDNSKCYYIVHKCKT